MPERTYRTARSGGEFGDPEQVAIRREENHAKDVSR